MSIINQKRRAIKAAVISKIQQNVKDTGSVTVQIELLKFKRKSLQEHQLRHPNDVTIKRTLSYIQSQIVKLTKYMNR